MKRLYAVLAVLVAALLLYNPINSILAIVSSHALPHSIVLLAVGLVAALIYKWRMDEWRAFVQAPLVVKLAAAMLALCCLNILYGDASLGQAIRGFNVDFGGLFMFLIIWGIAPTQQDSKRLTWVMLAALGIILAFAIPDAISPLKFEAWAKYPQMHYVVGGKGYGIPQVRSITTGPNPLGTLMTLTAFVLVMLVPNPAILAICIAIVGFIMGLTYGRSVWGGAALGAGGYFVYQWVKNRRALVWPIVLGATIFVGAAFGAIRNDAGIAGVIFHGQSTQEHQQAAIVAAKNEYAESVKDKILGYGLGMAGPVVLTSPPTMKLVSHYKNLESISESWYIQVLQELGIVGFLLYLALFAELTRQLFRKNKLVGFLAIGLAINALTLEIWAGDANLNLIFWTLAALTLYSQANVTEKARAK